MTRMNIILGTMTFGKTPASRITDPNTVGEIINIFGSYGYKEIDTARVYCDGTTEEVLADLQVFDKFKVATKVAPRQPGDHQPERLKAIFQKSLEALKTDKVDILYLHAPDHSTPIEDTLSAVQEIYEKGHFERFGLSNYAAWQVSAICEIMRKNNWVQPTVYQGMYNALTRDVEHELFPCLKHYGILFNAYNPLAGGLLSPHYENMATRVESNSRFDPETNQGKMYRDRYWNQTYFDAISKVHQVAKESQLSPTDIALRWMVHHSLLNKDKGDGIIIGTSSVAHTEQNLKAVEQGPLPEHILDALNAAWEVAMVKCPPYYR
ncbi:aldo keto reductase [Lichtheimia corymbifera JMRC:FSU:9682]|uniref:Aldo keto reductase n=1 Tax=Lichtheimia corymbifera JMRC:FSU:9682 TaxID=1263082 RepID=A0A068RRN7_9FUNG|nr:aldo keto reductase [Lichtheimia corymbifera JMRC:FSU:9682]